MNIDAAVRRQFQHGPGKDLPIGHHHDQVRFQRDKFREGLLAAQAFRLEDRKIRLQRQLLDPGWASLGATTDWTIRLRHQPDEASISNQHPERREGYLPRSHEHDSQGTCIQESETENR